MTRHFPIMKTEEKEIVERVAMANLAGKYLANTSHHSPLRGNYTKNITNKRIGKTINKNTI